MFAERLQRLQAELTARQVPAAVLIPGANLRYLTGVDFHLMERPILGFFSAAGHPSFAVPGFEAAKLEEALPYPIRLFTYADGEDYLKAVRPAFQAAVGGDNPAVEHLQMRVLELKLLEACAPGLQVQDADPILAALRMIKAAAEVEAIRAAVEVAEAALSEVLPRIQAGQTEAQIAALLRQALFEAGSQGDPFEPIVLIGARSALPHGSPGQAALRPGDALLLDFGARYAGYLSDITRVFFCAHLPDPEAQALYEAVRAANAAGRAAARPSVTCQAVDRAARQVMAEAGFGAAFTHRTGHGIGLDAHEGPYIVEGNELLLAPGMVFTIEPGGYLPGLAGVRIEDDVLITAEGCDTLTTFPRELQVIAG